MYVILVYSILITSVAKHERGKEIQTSVESCTELDVQERARAVRHSIAQRSTGILAAGPDDSLGQGDGPTRLSMPAPHSLEVHSPHPANKLVFYDQDVTHQV